MVAFSGSGRENERTTDIPGTEPVMSKHTSSKSSAATKRELTPEAQELRRLLLEAAANDIDELAELLAGTTDATIFGQTEFTIRDIVHRVGAKAVETALRERKKGGTSVPA